MELKPSFDGTVVANPGTFNRTRMELKLNERRALVWPYPPFNRTRMELKRSDRAISMGTSWSFNRTRMELKLAEAASITVQDLLLTVPEWN